MSPYSTDEEKREALKSLRANLEKPWAIGARGYVAPLYLERWESDGGALFTEGLIDD